MRADVLLARCGRGSGLYGLRVEERLDSWYSTWAFPIGESHAQGEKYQATSVNGGLLLDSGFPGCPRCGANSFALCSQCGKLSCWSTTSPHWRCDWFPCTATGSPSGSITSFTAHGDR